MTFPINNPHHGRNYLTRKDVYELFDGIELKSKIKIVKLKRFALLIDKFYAKVQSILKPPREADIFEDFVRFDMMKNPKRIYALYKLITVILFKISENSYYENVFGDRALIIAEKVQK